MRKSSIILVHGDLAVVRLIGRHSRGEHALIDAADVPLVEGYSWHKRLIYKRAGSSAAHYYAYSRVNGKSGALHQVIMDTKRGELVDHIDHNTLDCRRDNLRICSHLQNMMNRRKSSATSNPYKGITKRYGKWVAQIRINGKPTRIGRFLSEVEAAQAYDRAALEHYGEFANLNFDQDCDSSGWMNARQPTQDATP